MRATWAILIAFLAAMLFAAGCGGGGEDLAYEDEDDTDSGGASVTPGMPGMGVGVGGTPTDEDPTRGGYAPRITKGSGQESLGTEEMTQAEHEAMKGIGQDITKAEKMYKQYMEKKEQDGTKDEGIKNSALSMYDSILQRLNKLMEKYPDSKTLQDYHNTASYNSHALSWE